MNALRLSTLLVATVSGIAACGDDSPTEPDKTQNTLVVTRADNSQVSFAASAFLYVWCGPWEAGVVDTPSVQVLFGGPAGSDPHWWMKGVVADVVIGQALTFPNSFVWDQPTKVDLFVGDPPNELSTQQGNSSGSITFQKLDCTAGGEVAFTIDAVVGSELGGGPSVSVAGGFRGPVGGAPPSPTSPLGDSASRRTPRPPSPAPD
ncbi:MAG TPA: hypothetical protein PKA66_02640 [Gemmatimonadales bacterium]|nr:hypothetical protein [Gemmatimonadales bacterium]